MYIKRGVLVKSKIPFSINTRSDDYFTILITPFLRGFASGVTAGYPIDAIPHTI